MEFEITPDVANSLGYYVYAYVDPRDEQIFYIGKGVGSRAKSHLKDRTETRKLTRIEDIWSCGMEPRIDIIAHNLRDDLEAKRVEAALIELVGIKNLTNQIRGQDTVEYPRKPLDDFIMEFAPTQAEINDPCLLIRINKRYRYGMSKLELYESTRGIWVVGSRRNNARYAMAVYAGIIREVYEIESWHPAGSTAYQTRHKQELAQHSARRWEFLGNLAEDTIRQKYRGRSVSHLFKKGQQSPVVGVGLEN